MGDPSERLLNLLSLLQTPRDWSGTELARRLAVTTRTVRRDIDRLRALGYPVQAAMGPDGGYRLVAGTAMPPLLLDDDEAVAIAIGLRIAAGQAVTGIEETAVRALAKLEQVLPKRLRRRVGTLGAATVPFTLRDDPSVDPDLLTRLAGLIENTERLRFDYVAADGSSTDRNVEPRSLVAQTGQWYLLGYDLDRGDWRTFRVDRIGTLRPTGHRFRPRDLPAESVEALVRRQVYARAPVYRAVVTLAAPVDRVARRFGGRDGLTPEGDGCRYVSHEDTIEFLAFRLFRLDCEFVVHEPPELINYLRRLSERSLRAAGPPS
ncbi:helix-turn-helix transcriptional regulator [Microlunatus parietis]|uniref:Putative DNA-binding transcriptional regulator YafY n=1 Tax=Microlunatus parietis TaxID=682979 RepID=A0A7Y9I6E7_9ACTN|nr:WYL domain-containing protein [Microlunatus parietis]NYE70992.1 putative DNA-binding transcriptional regulator YafY [Microlunatus parietis]